jgi:small neutral amino acid transporter SnatA (MarC family)
VAAAPAAAVPGAFSAAVGLMSSQPLFIMFALVCTNRILATGMMVAMILLWAATTTEKCVAQREVLHMWGRIVGS